MKRKYTKKFKRLWLIFPLFFWYKCNKCALEFRREKGWMALDVPLHFILSSYYLCRSCAPTRKIANEYFLSKKHLKEISKNWETDPAHLTNWNFKDENRRPKPTPVPPKSIKRAESKQPDRRQWQSSSKKYTGELRRNLDKRQGL